MRIKQLPGAVANQIAAGEVIERPASVVKELLENALDAGATMVNIDIGFGGLNQITVSDNGAGICADDMQLAIAAHATSKISTLTDLYHITTMGFRGEALASIASIARLSLESKPLDQAHGMSLHIEDSGIVLRPCARQQGTTVDVRDLFYNTPVRKLFLKTPRIEYQAIELVVKQFALSAPHIAISLKHNGKLGLHLPPASSPTSRSLRIKKLFGQTFLADAIYIEENQDFLRIEGWLSQQHYQRSQRDRQWVYLNQRFIKDKLIQQAIGQAYQAFLYPGRYASCLFYLSMAPEEVDVNVHPTKHEVRFREPRRMHSALVAVISRTLAAGTIAKSSPTPQDTNKGWIPAPSAITNMPRWTIINADFVMITLANNPPYLVNMYQIYQHYLAAIVQHETIPFSSRPLLVPIRHPITPATYTFFEQNQVLLAGIGLSYDFMSETCLVIRSLPRCFPYLDIGRFLTAILDIAPLHEAIVHTAILCQLWDASTMSSLEWLALVVYFTEHLESSAAIQAASLALDRAACQQIIVNKALYV